MDLVQDNRTPDYTVISVIPFKSLRLHCDAIPEATDCYNRTIHVYHLGDQISGILNSHMLALSGNNYPLADNCPIPYEPDGPRLLKDSGSITVAA